MPALVDTHAHLDFPQFDEDRAAVLERARQAGLELIINVGTSEESSEKGVQLSLEEPFLWAAVGVHPHFAGQASPRWRRKLYELARNPKVLAIGETGLDYYRDITPASLQEAVFREQLELARELNKPLIIHSRSAHAETWRLLDREPLPSPPGIMHCFSGEEKWAEAFLELGFYLSFAGPLTYPNAHALRELLKKIPLERLLLETDAPYLSPQPYRALRNEPAYIQATYQRAAFLLEIPLEELARQILENVQALFPALKKKS
ncbi:MAG TPA: TatD family hydrolase [Bacillota bacterium]|jgi:TatD DNase family protein|nr:TatD family hydrolase [Bacillota bacterium]HOB86137.1 TatD family hydrolase [Bacillota bacterium]HOP69645.1 TatD family hydrolase [Bacillota bacterium]HPT33177.1 TatD family hydrolase [Bacillota bacterium]HPZ64038.1 TatD family hydrolase [Bacillota bacterium]